MKNKMASIKTYSYADYSADILKMKEDIAVAEAMHPILKEASLSMEEDVVAQMCHYMLSACRSMTEFPEEVFDDNYRPYRKAGDSINISGGTEVKFEMMDKDNYLVHICDNYSGVKKVTFEVSYLTNKCWTRVFPNANKIKWLVENWECIKDNLNKAIEKTIEVYRASKTVNTVKTSEYIDVLKRFQV